MISDDSKSRVKRAEQRGLEASRLEQIPMVSNTAIAEATPMMGIDDYHATSSSRVVVTIPTVAAISVKQAQALSDDPLGEHCVQESGNLLSW